MAMLGRNVVEFDGAIAYRYILDIQGRNGLCTIQSRCVDEIFE
jgi:hypothetical protein